MTFQRLRSCALVVATACSIVTGAVTAAEYSPNVVDDFPDQVFWGDTHVHSSFSMDANSAGNTRLSPADAYRFARGEAVMANSGMTARLAQPLDFLVVSDHAEYMGLLPALRERDPALLGDPVGRRLADGLQQDAETGGMTTIGALVRTLMEGGDPIIDNSEFSSDIWNEITHLADAANEPGQFTALIGFEWSSLPGGDNLHRVVVYADGAEEAGQKVPVSAFDGERPEDLWAFMEAYEDEVGGRILAIPHNANLSNGRMFELSMSDGQPFDEGYASRRARHEPLVEVTQIKGDAETHPLLSPDDEFADFETWDFGNLHVLKTVPKREGMIEFEYTRSVLKLGLDQAARTGVNPFALGMIGSTDAHTSLAAVAEDDFWGKTSGIEPGPRAAASHAPAPPSGSLMTTWDFVASGYAAVWARENTREAIFDAMRRKEVYATTGSRIALRFFGGWEYDEADLHAPDVARIGYRKGVPMGGALASAPSADAAPRFLVTALKDPLGANLDRVQIVKGWREDDGTLREKVFDVALSNHRHPFLGRIRPLKSTVDVETATYSNERGDTALGAYWRDPDFEPSERAFYYARVIEIPTPRWSVYDAVRLGADVPDGVPTEVQDRAYSSPIWYTPGAQSSE